ncbi:unnamed protein product [Lasius platythorax]|uniref:Uncharacterized protein n=1 Tax=Lasius platythorax TaxID=488582 RepID=A0AAV2NVL6_9HYME
MLFRSASIFRRGRSTNILSNVSSSHFSTRTSLRYPPACYQSIGGHPRTSPNLRAGIQGSSGVCDSLECALPSLIKRCQHPQPRTSPLEHHEWE